MGPWRSRGRLSPLSCRIVLPREKNMFVDSAIQTCEITGASRDLAKVVTTAIGSVVLLNARGGCQ